MLKDSWSKAFPLVPEMPTAAEMHEVQVVHLNNHLASCSLQLFLSRLPGIALLSDAFPEQVLPTLLDQYGSPQPGTRKVQTVETRMKVGEALMRTTRALGEFAVLLVTVPIAFSVSCVCVCVC